MTHKFPYKWTLKDAKFTKDKGKVFSCFACGGGSTMGYKLAGFDVLGCNEIDPKMMECYVKNHKPKYSYLEPIQTFKLRDDLPKELYDLDILDGSPPCSSFSIAGNTDKDWGKEKKFKEGQALQVLDTLFFDFIDLAKELQPKIVVAENVEGLLLSKATSYVIQIYKDFEKAGYYCQHFLLDASIMGVPQQRRRVFFIAIRKDLASKFIIQKDMFTWGPFIEMKFKEQIIPYNHIEDHTAEAVKIMPCIEKLFDKVLPGDQFSTAHPKGRMFNYNKVHPDKVLYTITAHLGGSGSYHYNVRRPLSKDELLNAGSFPKDYDFIKMKPRYLIGMSVPPVMTAQIASNIYDQWLSKIN